MVQIRRSLAIAASVGLVLGSSPALAQAGAQVSAERALAVWTEALKSALPLGYVEGTMQEMNGKGEVLNTNSDPSCMTETSRSELIGQISGAMNQIVGLGDCTAISGGEGSLNMTITCDFGNSKKLKIESAGTHGNGAMDLTVGFVANGPDAPDLGSMRLTTRRTRDC